MPYLLDLAHSVNHLTDTVVLDDGCRSDLRFWSLLCDGWNGISFITILWSLLTLSGCTQTRLLPLVLGDSIWMNGCKRLGNWDAFWGRFKSFALFELYPIVVACVLWDSKWSREQITVFCDNVAIVEIINKGRSKISPINSLMRRLMWTSFSILILHTTHIPGHDYRIADALSRFKLQEFRTMCTLASSAAFPVLRMRSWLSIKSNQFLAGFITLRF